MGILDKLMDPAAEAVRADHSLGDPPDDESTHKLRPSTMETAVMSQTAVAEEEQRADRERQKERDASTPANNKPRGLSCLHRGPAPVHGQRPASRDPDADAFRDAGMVEDETFPLVTLTHLLKSYRWGDAASPDPEKRAQARVQELHIRRILRIGCARGQHEALANVWAQYASPEAPGFEDMVKKSVTDSRPAQANPPESGDRKVKPQPRQAPSVGVSRSSVAAGIVTWPLVAVKKTRQHVRNSLTRVVKLSHNP